MREGERAQERNRAPKIEQLRGLFITTRAVPESWRLVEHNDYSSAHHLLSSARALLMKSGSVSADEYVHDLEAELSELALEKAAQDHGGAAVNDDDYDQTTERRRGKGCGGDRCSG
ncbi:hypothetical protein ACFX2H_043886 [Malus domestica]